MNRYFILMLTVVLCCGFLFGDEPGFWSQKIPNPDQSLDTSLSTGPNWWRFVRVSRDPNGTYFGAQTLAAILNFLVNTNAWTTGIWNAGWGDTSGGYGTGNSDTSAWLSQMQQDLADYLDPDTGFEQGSEVFTMLLQSGDTSFADGLGNIYPDSGSIWEPNDFHDIRYYCGRNTSLGGYNNQVNPDGSWNTEYYETEYTVETNAGAYRITFWETNTPIILDMDGDGKLEASGGMWLPHPMDKDAKTVAFDLTGNGFDEVIEWVGPHDGILLTYTPGETVTGNNLFGKAGGYDNGYEKLMTLDENQDKKLTGDELKTLSVWQDDGNAKVDKGEVTSVASLGITEFGIEHANLVSYFVQNNVKKMTWDWNPVMLIVKKLKDK